MMSKNQNHLEVLISDFKLKSLGSMFYKGFTVLIGLQTNPNFTNATNLYPFRFKINKKTTGLKIRKTPCHRKPQLDDREIHELP